MFKWIEEAIFEEMEDALPRIDIIANEVIKGKSETNVLVVEIQEMQEEALLRKKELHKCIWCLNVCFVWLFVMTIVVLYGMSRQPKET